MKRFLGIIIIFSSSLLSANGKDAFNYRLGVEFIPQTYLPQHDVFHGNRFMLSYTGGPSLRIDQGIALLTIGLHYSRVNEHFLFDYLGYDGSGYQHYYFNFKTSSSHINLSVFPGLQFGKGKNKFCINAGSIISYLYRSTFKGVIESDNGENRSYDEKGKQSDWHLAFGLAFSYFHSGNGRISYKIEPGISYHKEYSYWLPGLNAGIYYNLFGSK